MENFIGLILLIGTFIGAIVLGGSPLTFVDIPSIVFVLGVVVGSLVWKFGIRNIRVIWSSIEQRRQFCEIGQISSVSAAIVGPIIGIIQMLQNLSDPKLIGPAMAVTLLTFLYGMIINLIFSLIKNNSNNNEEKNVSKITNIVGLFGFFLCYSTVFIMLQSFQTG